MKKELLNKKNIKVIHDTDKNYLYLNWTGFQQEEQIYESGKEVLAIFMELDCSKVINDNREVIGPWNKAANWTQEFWFPEMIKAGLQQFAWIFPDNVFAELSAEDAMPDTDVIRKFQSYDSAEHWLEASKELVK